MTNSTLHEDDAMESIDSKTATAMIRDRVKQAANVSGEERVLAGLHHSDLSMQVVEDGIRHQNPEATDEQIQLLLMRRVDLMRRLERRHEHL